jgi:asparagine synthetase B (glutamine-hydrolysing)
MIELHKTDWLGSNPIFYNSITNQYSKQIMDLVEYSDFEYCNEGLIEYFNFGFSVFGNTVFKGIKYTVPNSTLLLDSKGVIHLRKDEDPVIAQLGIRSNVEKVIEMSRLSVERIHQDSTSVILPLSGGYDSRFIASFLSDSNKTKTFTYGISKKQEDSFEVAKAKVISSKLKISNQFISLHKINSYLEESFRLYGPTMHAHSMYHFDFYSQIASRGFRNKSCVISGIYGDLWAGNHDIEAPAHPGDLQKYGLSYSMSASRIATRIGDKPSPLKVKITTNYADYFESNRQYMSEEPFRLVTIARMKMMLIRHLIVTPEHLGFHVESPFLDLDLAMAMCQLPAKLRMNRKWQLDYFKQRNLDIPDQPRRITHSNDLDFYSVKQNKLPKLNVRNLEGILPRAEVERIQRNVRYSLLKLLLRRFRRLTLVAKLTSKLKIRPLSWEKAYAEYMILYPISQIENDC